MTERVDLRTLFEGITGPEYVREAGGADAVDGRQSRYVVAPGSTEEVAEALRTANEHELSVIPRGGGTKLDWGNVPRGADVIVSTARLNRLLEHAHGDMTATVEAGIGFGTMQRALAEHGQMLALDPPWPGRATLGGVIAADSNGPLRVRYGTMRDLLIGITVALPDGTVARAGGKVVKNVAGYDLMKLFTGSLGTLGLITAATIRLHPRPVETTSLYVAAATAEAAERLVLDLNASTLTPTGLQIISANAGYGVCVRFGGMPASVRAQTEQLRARAEAADMAVHALNEAQDHAVWQAPATVYAGADEAIVARLSVLPASIASTLNLLHELASRLRLVARVVIHATGTGVVRIEGGSEPARIAAIGTLRARLAEIDGSLVAHKFPLASKEHFDVWGSAGDALPLMRRVKEQFDPNGIMNPGRYIGRI